MLDYIIQFLMIQYSYILLIMRNDIKWNIFRRIMLSRKPKIWFKTRHNYIETVILWLYFKVIICISQNIISKYYNFIIVSSYFDSYLGFSGWHYSEYNTGYDCLHGIQNFKLQYSLQVLKSRSVKSHVSNRKVSQDRCSVLRT